MNVATYVRDDGSSLIVLAGEIDISCADDIEATALGCFDRPECTHLVLDLMDVTFLESRGIAALVVIRNVSLRIGKQLTLLDPSARVTRVLELTGLGEVFDIQRTTK